MKKTASITFSFDNPNTAEVFEEELKKILLRKLSALLAESSLTDREI